MDLSQRSKSPEKSPSDSLKKTSTDKLTTTENDIEDCLKSIGLGSLTSNNIDDVSGKPAAVIGSTKLANLVTRANQVQPVDGKQKLAFASTYMNNC